ncbi:MAG TPA: polysaccharide deacetylase family protein, partial [Vicinamibacterales bacterium]
LLFVAPPSTRQVALTFDDLPDLTADEHSVAKTENVLHSIIGHLAHAHVPAIGFVNESKLMDPNEQPDPRMVKLLSDWLDAGLDLGNHTFSHEGLEHRSLSAYEEDVLAGERITRPLCEQHGRKYECFRHPYLDTGRTLDERDALNRFLAEHGYRVAPVTIDNSEWIFAMAYEHTRNPITRLRLGRAYIRYMERRFAWYEAKSRLVFDREIPQIVLLHADSLNARFLPQLMAMIRRRGYRFITIDDAMRDPAYASKDTWASDAGVSWIERWGVSRGIPESVFDSDPHVPLWVQKIAGIKDD